MKKWWIRAIVFSLIWAVIVIGGGIVHVISIADISDERAEQIAGFYGFVCGVGLIGIWVWQWRTRPFSAEPLRDLMRD